MENKDKKPLLSVIMPAYNEEKTIKDIFEKVQKAEPKNKEIIIIDDFSTDKTRHILKKLKKYKNTKIITHEKNKGKGFAIRTGLKHTTGKIILVQDADLEYDPKDYEKLIEPIKSGKTKIVYGSRRLNKENKQHSGVFFFLGGYLLTKITNLLYPKAKITDEPTCYKVFSSDVIKNIPLKCEGFEFCSEITSKVLKKKHKIHEVPISYYPRNKNEGKKIKLKDGFEAIYTLIKYRLRKID